MTEYEVVCAQDSVEALEVQVNNAYEQGWVAQGSVCVVRTPDGGRDYYQAMTRSPEARVLAESLRPKVST